MDRRQVDIGGGVTLDAIVRGHGPVTVVFENGLATALEEWDGVAPSIAERARTLCYDRRRAAADGAIVPRTAADMAADLERLLQALAIGPPYVLVGHSWGGVVARLFAHRHPRDVVGIVLVDATHEVIDSRGLALLPVMYGVMGLVRRTQSGRRWLMKLLCPAGSPASYRLRLEHRIGDKELWRLSLRTARSEGGGIRSSLAEVTELCPELPDVPIQVLTAGPRGGNARGIARVHDAWRATVARAPAAHYRNVPESGHQMPMEAPDAVIAAIGAVLDAAPAQHGASPGA